jgi:hypothetical protein
MKKQLNLTVIFIFLTKIIFCQCLKDSIFQIDSVGNLKEKLALKLFVKVNSDSVHILTSLKSKIDFIGFKIIKLKKCRWNKESTVGFQIYLLIEEKSIGFFETPILKIEYDKDGKKWFELKYPKKEARIFTIFQ